MFFRFFLTLLLCFHVIVAFASDYILEGRIVDKENEEPLWNANVFIEEEGGGTSTNEEGHFSVSLPEGNYTIRFSYLGYQTRRVEVELNEDKYIEEFMVPQGYDYEEVEIEGRRDRTVETTEMSRVELEMTDIESLPVVFGEIDILKTLQLTPGVQNTAEGSNSLNVRGGGPDQNLILLDGAPIYNPSHLFGFFSVFHPDAIEDFSLTKGGMPARYGGRLSSILDVNLKSGDPDNFRTRGGVGLISSRIMTEGPINDGQGGFMVGGRRTYIDVLAQPFLPDEQQGNRYYFYDLTGKAHYRLNAENTVSFSGYLGRDIFDFGDQSAAFPVDVNSDWGNTVLALNWDRVINNDLFANYNLFYTDYGFTFGVGQDIFEFTLLSEIRDVGGRARFNYYLGDDHEIRFGAEFVNHRVEPGFGRIEADGEGQELELSERRANHLSLYAEDNWEITDRLKVNYGLRYSLYNQVGPYESLNRNEQGVVDDTSTYSNWEHVALYDGWEPRLSARYFLQENTSLKASATRNYQFIHLASATGGTLPTDVWVPSSELVKPQRSDQVAGGIVHEIPDMGLELSVESYYKWMDNQVDFRPGADLILNPFLDEEFLQGKGTAYGVEFLIEKDAGDWGGWISYTWSNTDRTIEGINQGRPYSPRFDITHDLSLVANYEFNDEWDASLVFVYSTGRPFTPELGYMFGDFGGAGGGGGQSAQPGFQTFPVFAEERNSFRMENYHRADVSVNYRPGGPSKPGEYNSYWNFSVFNIYNRKNPYFYNFDYNIATGEQAVEKVYIFPIIPSVTYNFRF